MSEWQPIGTARKSRKPILIGWWNGKTWETRRAWYDRRFEPTMRGYRGAWTDGAVKSWGYEQEHSYKPTHWMPLPEPPK